MVLGFLSKRVNDIRQEILTISLSFASGDSRACLSCLSGDAWTHAGVAHVICDGMSVMYASGSACIIDCMRSVVEHFWELVL